MRIVNAKKETDTGVCCWRVEGGKSRKVTIGYILGLMPDEIIRTNPRNTSLHV